MTCIFVWLGAIKLHGSPFLFFNSLSFGELSCVFFSFWKIPRWKPKHSLTIIVSPYISKRHDKNKRSQSILVARHCNKGRTLKGLLWYSTAKYMPGVIFTLRDIVRASKCYRCVCTCSKHFLLSFLRKIYLYLCCYSVLLVWLWFNFKNVKSHISI